MRIQSGGTGKPFALQGVVSAYPGAPFLDAGGDLTGERALLLQPDEGLATDLFRRGCSSVVQLAGGAGPDGECADAVIVPDLAPGDCALTKIAQARRALSDAGRILVWTAADPSGRIAHAAEAALRRSGFSAIRTIRSLDRAVIMAEVPLFGPRVRA
jgi:hypothetical protein